jgi:mono/diheme cytochrome c family protein
MSTPPPTRQPGLPAGLMATLRVLSALATVIAFLLFGVSLLGAIPGLWSLRGAAGAPAGPSSATSAAASAPSPTPSSGGTDGAGEAARTVAAGGAEATGDSAALWKRNCQPCHGPGGVPSPMGAKLGARDLTSPAAQALGDADLKRSIADGKGKMPAFKAILGPGDIDALVAHIRGLRDTAAPAR